MNRGSSPPTSDVLIAWVQDARRRTVELITDLKDDQLLGAPLPTLNPLLWEIGHVAWFAERWVLRHANRRPPLRPDADALYDSAAVAHDTRWDLQLPPRDQTLRYMADVEKQILQRLAHRKRRRVLPLRSLHRSRHQGQPHHLVKSC